MSVEENKAIERRFMEEVWNQGHLDVADEVLAPDVVIHGFPLPVPGVEGVKHVIAAFRTAFPDSQMTIDDLLAEGDTVGTRWTYRGTQQHEFMGIPATGKRVLLTGIHLDRIARGKIVERWLESNHADLVHQLGANPP